MPRLEPKFQKPPCPANLSLALPTNTTTHSHSPTLKQPSSSLLSPQTRCWPQSDHQTKQSCLFPTHFLLSSAPLSLAQYSVCPPQSLILESNPSLAITSLPPRTPFSFSCVRARRPRESQSLEASSWVPVCCCYGNELPSRPSPYLKDTFTPAFSSQIVVSEGYSPPALPNVVSTAAFERTPIRHCSAA